MLRYAGVLLSLTVVTLFSASIIGALRTHGNESFKAKWADWLRDHSAGVVVNHMEAFYYGHHVPPKGGRPDHLNHVPGAAGSGLHAVTPTAQGLTPPSDVPLVVRPGLQNEGHWLPSGPTVDGSAAMYIAQFRADATYTSQLTTAVWVDPRRLRVALVPGATEPGGSWSQPPYITADQRTRVLAAFNGGFRFKDAHGGFYFDGREAVALRDGAASVAIYDDGRVDVGAWGRDDRPGTHVIAVLQNLVLMVDHGKINPNVSHNDQKLWGDTLGVRTVVARSGIGVTGNGALVYVAGPALTARTLAESLQRAGAVRAMTLDINPEWVTFNLFTHPDPSNPASIVAERLYPQIQRPATRYLGPTAESRDFFTVSLP